MLQEKSPSGHHQAGPCWTANPRWIRNTWLYHQSCINRDCRTGHVSIWCNDTVEFEGAAIYNKGELIIDNSLFTRNAAFRGGAIYNENDLIIKDCKFINNIAGEGNDIFTENKDNLNISNSICQFINNDNY